MFRQTDVLRTAQQAQRSLTWLEDQVARRLGSEARPTPARLPEVGQPAGFDFVEVKAEDAGDVDVLLRQLGFTFRGRHRSKPVRLWTQGRARVVCNEQQARDVGADAGRGRASRCADPAASAGARRALDAPRSTGVPRRRAGAGRVPGAGRHRGLPRRRGPRATPPGSPEFEGGDDAGAAAADHRHRPRQPRPPLAALRRGGAVLQQRPRPGRPGAARRSRRRPGWSAARWCASDDGGVRLALNVAPLAYDPPRGLPQHVAFSATDALAVARAAP